MFSEEPYSDILIGEMIPLWVRHHAETVQYVNIPLEPNTIAYQQAAKAGIVRIFTARIDGKLIGYQVFFVMPHLHSRHSLQATQDIIFIDREYRKGLTGYKFIKFCSDKLISDGVQVIYQHISAHHDFGPVLKRMGYELVDLVYGRLSCQQPLQ